MPIYWDRVFSDEVHKASFQVAMDELEAQQKSRKSYEHALYPDFFCILFIPPEPMFFLTSDRTK
jgi:hypothetical protein